MCESPHTIVMPGRVIPSSGPITCTMPWYLWLMSYSVTPNSSQFLESVCIWMRAISPEALMSLVVVETL
ncbi:Uncharacterised protein [Vibrio cholerae]|nr:Uncharacterised protein [Vibrio cholerae]CSI03803.1 Uncharacterised protein [Vibrio cholerae]CSI64567.1 Uncharacterised protein [Vibrio cholerae]